MSIWDPNAPIPEEAGLFGLPHSPEEAAVVVLAAPWDATTSYGQGTAQGPTAIVKASHQLDLYDVEVGRPYEQGIAMVEPPESLVALSRQARAWAEPIHRGAGVAGNKTKATVAMVDEAAETLHGWLEAEAKHCLSLGKLVGVLGGDHSVPLGLIRVLGESHPGLGILQLDAHADLRSAYEGFRYSHASIMRNVLETVPSVQTLVQVGVRDLCDAEWEFIQTFQNRIRTFFDADLANERLRGQTWSEQCKRIVDALPSEVYVSFDIDGLDPSLCPNTGTPVPGGLGFHQACYLLRTVVESGRRIVGFDLCEVAPEEWDANVGARILYKLIGWAIRSALPLHP